MKRPRPFSEFPGELCRSVRFVLTDVDDTLTDGPRLSAATYAALERLRDAGVTVIPVTAAPAGWCDLMCRMWPVAAVIGENGGLCFRYDTAAGRTRRRYWAETARRHRQFERLTMLAAEIAATVPGCEIAHDQRFREASLAFRYTGPDMAAAIVARLEAAGARTTLNSIWVLGWFGRFDKLAMTRRVLNEGFGIDVERDNGACLFAGDSLNDEPMFAAFDNSVGVAGVRRYLDRLAAPPRWITAQGGGGGFVEIAERLLRCALSP